MQKIMRGVAGAALLAALVPATTSAEKVNLSYGSPLPATHALNAAVKPFLERLEKESGGEIRYQFYPGGTTAKLKAVMGSIRDGMVDSGYMIDSLTPAEQSYNVLAGRVSTHGTDAMVMAGAANEYLLLECKQCVDQLRKQGIVPLAYVATTPFVMMCRDDWTSAEQLRGKKIRAPGSYGQIVAGFGGVPVNVPPTDIFEALQRGQADCTFGPEAHLTNYSLYEVAKYVIDHSFGLYMSGSVFNMNKDRWESLSGEHRKVIQANLASLVAESTRMYMTEAAEARRTAESNGVTYRRPADSLVAILEDYRADLAASIDKTARSRKIDDIAGIVDKFPAIHAKWQKIVADIQHDDAKFQEALNREVYAKYQP